MNELKELLAEMQEIKKTPEWTETNHMTPQRKKKHDAFTDGFDLAMDLIEQAIKKAEAKQAEAKQSV